VLAERGRKLVMGGPDLYGLLAFLDQRTDQTQEFLLLWAAASPNKKRSDLDVSDLAA
jgi:hypothetical protein